MKLPHECSSIKEIRQEIDEIDNTIISLIGKRYSFVQEIIKYKNNIDEVYANERYLSVISERRRIAALHHMDPDVVEKIYRIMIDYFIKVQLELLKKKQK